MNEIINNPVVANEVKNSNTSNLNKKTWKKLLIFQKCWVNQQ